MDPTKHTKNTDFDIDKIDGTKNPADIFTKSIGQDLMELHLDNIGYAFVEGRADNQSKLHQICRKSAGASDYWKERNRGNDATWLRVHAKVREAMFTPMKVAKGPTSGSEVGKWRHSFFTSGDGPVSYSRDDWESLQNAHERFERPMYGITLFCSRRDLTDANKYALMHYARGRGGVQNIASLLHDDCEHDRIIGST